MLTQTRLKELLHYDPESGSFTRKARSAVRCRGKVGDVLGSINSRGYLTISVDNKKYQAHRLAWLLTHGEFPPDQIDHINGIKTDNRIANLRPATRQENGQNSKKRKDNTSGFKGASFDKQRGKWKAVISVPLLGERSLGYFDTPEAAAAMYAGAARLFHAEFVHIETLNITINIQQGKPQ